MLKCSLPEVAENKLALAAPISRPQQLIHFLDRDVHVHVEIIG